MTDKPSSARKPAFDAEQLAALLPAALGEWQRKKLGRPVPTQVPEPQPALQAEYVLGQHTAALALMTELPITTAEGSRTIHHQRREDRQQNIATLPLRNGLTIIATSHGADATALAGLIQAIDLERAEKLVRTQK